MAIPTKEGKRRRRAGQGDNEVEEDGNGELAAVAVKASFAGLMMEPSFAEEGNPSRPTRRGELSFSKHK